MRIGFDQASGSIVIMGNGSFLPRTLAAEINDAGEVRVTSLADQCELYCRSWQTVQTLAGATFDTAAAAMAYLTGELERAAAGDVPTASAVAGTAIPAGFPVALARSNGLAFPARADTYALSFVTGLASERTEPGFAADIVRSVVVLPDWSEAAGEPALLVGAPYFLGPAGGLTRAPSLAAGGCLVRLGALSTPRPSPSPRPTPSPSEEIDP